MTRRGRSGWAVLARIGLLTMVTFGILEGLLRLAGFTPRAYREPGGEELLFGAVHPSLGWVNSSAGGTYVATHRQGGREVQVTATLLPGGERITSLQVPEPEDPRTMITILGGSYTFGWGINDEDTYPWKLQLRLPSHWVRNLGVSGYGTYHALLSLEQLLEQERPRVVIYGFIEHHTLRNINDYEWLWLLDRSTKKGHVRCPFVALANGQMIRRPPERLRHVVFRDHLAVSANLIEPLMNLGRMFRRQNKDRLTQLLLLEMRQLCVRNDCSFVVGYLHGSDEAEARYRNLCEQEGIAYVDVRPPSQVSGLYTTDDKTPHPTGRYNEYVAEGFYRFVVSSGIEPPFS